MKYRKKPIVIDAEQIFSGMIGDLLSSAISAGVAVWTEDDMALLFTDHGEVVVRPGEWLIKGIEGEFYPCADSVFKATYEPVEETA